jgi:putative endonuclease
MQKSLKTTASYYKGINGEQKTCDYFEQLGYEILAKRYKSSAGEIDLIITKNQCLIFVEVKSRATKNDGLQSISNRQQLRIIASAECFIGDNFAAYQHYDVRFDVITLDAKGKLTHIENAFGQY